MAFDFKFVPSQNSGSLGLRPGLLADCACGQHQTIKSWEKPTATAAGRRNSLSDGRYVEVAYVAGASPEALRHFFL